MVQTLLGVVHDVCDVERLDFRGGAHLWLSVDDAWAIRVSSAGWDATR